MKSRIIKKKSISKQLSLLSIFVLALFFSAQNSSAQPACPITNTFSPLWMNVNYVAAGAKQEDSMARI